ncbi:MAG: type IX secretion system membrane protein PorP/SprF [Robiginitalea sp.]
MSEPRDRNTFKIPSVLLLMALLLSFGSLQAQREPFYTQYMYNIGSFNPAYVGTVENTDFNLLYRAQWIDIPGAPRTIRFGINAPLGNRKHGLGFNVMNDQLGPTTSTFVDVSYSFQIEFNYDVFLSFGLDAGGSFLNVDFSKGSFENPGEPILNEENISEFTPTVGAGIFLYHQLWYLGVSVPNFLTDGLYSNAVAQVVEDQMQFNFIGGYVFELNDNLKFKPAFLVNYISGSPVNGNISTNFLLNDKFTLGAAYRFDNAVSGLAGFQVSENIFLGYAYDYNTNGLGGYNSGSHEAIVKFNLGGSGTGERKGKKEKGKGKQIDSPRFF